LVRLYKFFILPPSERRLLIRAGFWVAIIRLGLWLLPYPLLRRRLTPNRLAPNLGGPMQGISPSPERIAWAVEKVARIVPRTTCLTQALAVQALLSRIGYASQLSIGVAKDKKGQLVAHAWVKSQGKVVIGGSEFKYTPLANL
jgi:hypothetical protein